jgi:hypothetical protein
MQSINLSARLSSRSSFVFAHIVVLTGRDGGTLLGLCTAETNNAIRSSEADECGRFSRPHSQSSGGETEPNTAIRLLHQDESSVANS